MKARLCIAAAVVCLLATAAPAQQPQPLTIISDYTIRPGQEAAWDELVRTVGAPVRNQLMQEGVVLGWGVDVTVLRVPGAPTHSIWVTVNGWSGLEKYLAALSAAVARIPAERVNQILDLSRTRDFIIRDVISGHGPSPPPAGVMPFSRLNIRKVQPGKGRDFLQVWNRYNKPVFDKLVADGVLWAYGVSVEAVPTSNEFTHVIWMSGLDLESVNARVGAAFAADRQARSEQERTQIGQAFRDCLDLSVNTSVLLRATHFRIAMPPQ